MFDALEQLWFVPTTHVAEQSGRWLPPRFKIPLDVSVCDHRAALSRGALTDKDGLFVPIRHRNPSWFNAWLPDGHPSKTALRALRGNLSEDEMLTIRVRRVAWLHESGLQREQFTNAERERYEELLTPRSLDPKQLCEKFYGGALYSLERGFCGICDSDVYAHNINERGTHLSYVIGLRTEELRILKSGVKGGEIKLLRVAPNAKRFVRLGSDPARAAVMAIERGIERITADVLDPCDYVSPSERRRATFEQVAHNLLSPML